MSKTNPKITIVTDRPVNEPIIKTARVYEQGGMIQIDYRVHPSYRYNGKDRTRFSTGEVFSKRRFAQIQRDVFSLVLEHYYQNVNVLDSENLTLGSIALDAINDGIGNRQSDSHNDYLNVYEVHIKPTFEHTLLNDIKPTHVKAWKNTLLTNHKLSSGRYQKYHRVLNFIFKYALENDMIDRNPVALVDKRSKLFTKAKQTQGEKYYTATEVKLMLEHATGWFKVMLITYLHTGMRTGEGLALQWMDIDFENSTITIQRSMRKGILKESTKTGEDRVIIMSESLKQALEAYKKVCISELWLFPNPKTAQPYYEANSITQWHFKPLLKKLEISYKTFYALRHTFASLSVENQIPMSIIQKQLGHRNIATTMSFYVKQNLISKKNKNIFDKLYA